MASEDSLISEFLEELALLKYRDKFIAEGPLSVGSVGEFSRFLSDPDALKGIGMSVFEINRFKRLCKETIQELQKRDVEPSPAVQSIPKVKEIIEDKTTFLTPSRNTEVTKNSKQRLKLKPMTQECIIRKLTYSLTVDLSTRYYQLITEIHQLLGGDIRGINFESVELFSDTGYPLAVSPHKYLQPISEWRLAQNAMLYVYPKNIPVGGISPKQLYEHSHSIKVAIESTDIILRVTLCHVKLFCCELKTILSLQLHIPTDVIELHILSVDAQIKEIPSDRFELEMKLVIEERLLISIRISEHWKEESYLGAFSSNLYKSCLPHNNATDWDCFSCLLLYLSKEESGGRREDLLARLGLLRRVSGSPPLVYALYRLLTGRALCLPHRVAINEGILTTLSFLLSDREPSIHRFAALWMYLERNAQQQHSNTEVYETRYISKHTREIPRDQETQRLLQAFPPSEDTIVTWCDCPSAHEPFVYCKLSETEFSQNKINQRFPLQHPIALYKQYLESGIDYGLLPPITRDLSSYCVFLGPTKGRYGYFELYDPHEGKSTSCSPHDIITHNPMQIENAHSFPKLIIILDISRDMYLRCNEYTAGRDPNEHNLIITSLDMAIRIIELLTDTLIRLGSVYLLGVILISNNHRFTNGIYVLQTPTLEYVRTLQKLKQFIDTHPILQHNSTRLPQSTIINALYHIYDKFTPNIKDQKLQVFLLTDRKDYSSRAVLNILILSEYTSAALSGLRKSTKDEYLNQNSVEEIPSHYLLEYYSVFEDALDPSGLGGNFESYDRIHSTFRKRLVNSDSVLDTVQREKDRFTDLFATKRIPNLIQILRQISSYSKSPNPYCKLFSIRESIQHWLCLIQGPDNTPYQRSVLFLEIRFGTLFPQKPPTFRFLSSYFHPNIRLTGEVCHPILFEDYHPGVSLRLLMDSIYDMICYPVPSHAVRYKAMEIFSFHRDRYRHIVESFLKVYKLIRSVSDCKQDLCVQNDNHSKSSHPQLYLCPLTKQLFDQPVTTPDGYTYERHAILQHLKHQDTDPISESILTEGDLIPNQAMLSTVYKYRKKCCGRDYWWEQ